MHEILFRGKRKSDGAWVYGAYVSRNWYPSGKEFDFGGKVVEESNIIDYEYECLWNKVIPETVGQYTGLTDKNGNKIFEGDIVMVSQAKIENAVIKVEERTASIILEWIDTDKCNFMLDFYLKYGMTYTGIFEVIGNIHDNPELLKGAENDA